MTKENTKQKISTLELTYIAIFVTLMAICSWISIPTVIPFTLQTFAVFITLGLLGGKRGTLAVVTYIILGGIGIPVFAGFTGGAGFLFGTTGGYIFGFILMALSYWLITNIFGTKTWIMAISMVIGLALCYTFGTIWFVLLYAKTVGAISLATALAWCVVPFIIPDIIKIVLAFIIIKVVKRHVKL